MDAALLARRAFARLFFIDLNEPRRADRRSAPSGLAGRPQSDAEPPRRSKKTPDAATRRALPDVGLGPQAMQRRGRKLFLQGRIVHIGR